jgi:hypothetical protein
MARVFLETRDTTLHQDQYDSEAGLRVGLEGFGKPLLNPKG